MLAVFKRELQSYFYSAIGYVFMGCFLVIAGIFFAFGNVLSASSSVGTLFSNVSFIFILIVPILTMRLMSDERRSKSDQLLLTSPLSLWSIVCGKFLAACAVFFLTLVCTGLYVIILSAYGNVSAIEVFVNYLGFFLMGCCLIAVGLFMSNLSENQVASAISTFVVILFLYLLDSIIASMSSVTMLSWLCTALEWVSLFARFTDFSSGILSLTGVIYMISFAGVFLLLTVYTTEKRRWSEG